MFRMFCSALALLALLSGAGPAHAQLTDEQAVLIRQLPPPERVLAAIPPRKDPVENEVLRIGMLMEFNSLAQSLASSRMPRDLVDAADQYYAAQAQMREALLQQLGAGNDPEARQAAERRIIDVGESMFSSPRAVYKLRRQLFGDVLQGDLREYALAWHDKDPDARTAVSYFTPQWVRALPDPLIPVVDVMFNLPRAFWIALLAAWIALGIALRTSPFHLAPEDVWTLQRGRQRLPMQHRVSTVVDVRESVEKVSRRVQEVDGYNNTISDRTFTSTFHHVKLFLKSRDGERAVTLTNQGFDARAGHRILEVWDPKANMYLFFHNYDLGTTLPMGFIHQFVKMRPKIVIPVTLLAAYGCFVFFPAAFSTYTALGIAVVYLIFMGILTRRRYRKFVREMAPKMVRATSPEAAPGYIGNAEMGISGK